MVEVFTPEYMGEEPLRRNQLPDLRLVHDQLVFTVGVDVIVYAIENMPMGDGTALRVKDKEQFIKELITKLMSKTHGEEDLSLIELALDRAALLVAEDGSPCIDIEEIE